MGERERYEPGTFSWTDISTPAQDDAKRFYSGLFGWEANDLPVEEGVVYSMMQVDGKPVAAISPQQPHLTEAGVPPTWNSYVTVDSADDAAERAAELGANVMLPPFDVMTAGRMAVIADPQGAVFMVWQPGESIGAGLVNAPGALCWNELGTSDVEGAKKFYGDLFGWTYKAFDGAPMEYWGIHRSGGESNGGIRALNEGEPQPYWLVYFATDGVEPAAAKVEELGGTKHFGPVDIGVGKITVVQDPQGAFFVLYEGDLDD